VENEPDLRLVSLFEGLDDACVVILFSDDSVLNLKIVSTSHVDLDGTVIGVPVNSSGAEADEKEPGIEFHLSEVTEVRRLSSGTVLYRGN